MRHTHHRSVWSTWGLLTLSGLLLTRVWADDNEQRAQAAQLWHQVLEAKGGAERLHQVRTLLLRRYDDLKFHNPRWPDGSETIVELYVFPHRYWKWMDARKTIFGQNVSVYDLVRERAFLAYPDEPQPRQMSEGSVQKGRRDLRDRQLIFFCETEWIRPEPLRIRAEPKADKNIQVLEARLGDDRVEFWVDRTTHLPVEVVIYDALLIRQSRVPDPAAGKESYRLWDYSAQKGIVLPHRYGRSVFDFAPGPPLYLQLNVDYRPELFDEPISFEAGIDAWKSKGPMR